MFAKQKISPVFILIALLFLAAFLRLYRIDVLMRFIWDEGRDMIAMRNIIVNRDFTLFGPFNDIDGKKDFFGVFHYYLMLPALWFANFDPVGPAIFTALLGVASVGLSYIWVRKWADVKTALAVSAVMAVSPLVVRYQQWPWNPNTVGFFGLLYLLCLDAYQTRLRWQFAVAAGFLLGLLFQLHYFTLALGVSALLIFMTQDKKKWWHALGFFLAFVFPNLTFVLFDVTHAGLYRTILWDSFFGGGQQQFLRLSFWSLFMGPFQYLFDVCSQFFGSRVLAIPLLVVFVNEAFQRVRKLPAIIQKKELSHFDLVLFPWLVFLLMTSFFPSLLDVYHSAALWLGLAVVLVVNLRRLLPRFWIFIFLPLFVWMVWVNHIWREPTWQENMPRIRRAAFAITADMKKQPDSAVNIASFVDPDTRGVRFRYFILAENSSLLGVEQYSKANRLYVISPHTWEETRANPAWELNAFREATQAVQIWQDQDWMVYRVANDQ